MVNAPVVTDRSLGAIGVDLNTDHLAVCETDASGNPVNSFSVPLVTYGKSRRQAEAVIGDAVASVVAFAREAGKPIVLEKLDFRQKKAVLEGESPRYSRMLSSFSYGKVRACFLSGDIRQGVEVYQVNPAFSSVMGRVKFMERYGLSVHQAAALVLARRFLGYSEGYSMGQTGLSCWQRGPCRLHRTCKEADEARVDPVGLCSGTAETGACSAAPAGKAVDADPIRFELQPERGSFRCCRAGFRAEPLCTGGAAVRYWRILRRRLTVAMLQKSSFFTTVVLDAPVERR